MPDTSMASWWAPATGTWPTKSPVSRSTGTLPLRRPTTPPGWVGRAPVPEWQVLRYCQDGIDQTGMPTHPLVVAAFRDAV
ncbi:hypothetical protein AB0L10_23115 [Streptomyces flaveolus]|uniref:hypothetical protein n=1 Tax=Streptomyces flaveolus TaxID=67297 RepID=UPI00342D5F0F